jgi:hypothetical protein
VRPELHKETWLTGKLFHLINLRRSCLGQRAMVPWVMKKSMPAPGAGSQEFWRGFVFFMSGFACQNPLFKPAPFI